MYVNAQICFQLSGPSSVELLEDPHDSDVVNLAALLGLRKVENGIA